MRNCVFLCKNYCVESSLSSDEIFKGCSRRRCGGKAASKNLLFIRMTDVFIHLRTLSVVLMLVTALMASVMFVIWKTQKTYPGVGYRTVANLVAAGGFLLIALRGGWPEIVSVIAGSSLAVASLAIAYEGNRRFRG